MYQTISIQTSRPYNILIGNGLLEHLAEHLDALLDGKKPKTAVITDDTVNALYAEATKKRLTDAGYEVHLFEFTHGESSKNLHTVSAAYSFLSKHQFTRTDLIIALGGGVTGDLAGYIAATWLRGIRFIQIPTTFLAMIDSSVGGKTGVDILEGKNLVGAFWQPSLVLIDPNVLSTLPNEIFSDGTAEAIKYGAILDKSLFELLARGDLMEKLNEVIIRCVTLKRQVVEEDELDKGIRQWLNFGHTLGHAIERESNFNISHGKGVAIGMNLVTAAAEIRGLTPAGTQARIAACCERYGLPTKTDYPLQSLCAHALGDKKRSGAEIHLVLLQELGTARLHVIAADALAAFMKGAQNA